MKNINKKVEIEFSAYLNCCVINVDEVDTRVENVAHLKCADQRMVCGCYIYKQDKSMSHIGNEIKLFTVDFSKADDVRQTMR